MTNQSIYRSSIRIQIVAGLTLINAAIFIPPLALALLGTYRGYSPQDPYMGPSLSLATLVISFIAIALQVPITIVALFLKRNPIAAFQGAVLGSIVGALFGMSTIALISGGLSQSSSTGVLWIAITAGAWPLLARFLWPKSVQLDTPDTQPSVVHRDQSALVFLLRIALLVIALITAVVSTSITISYLSDSRIDALRRDTNQDKSVDGNSQPMDLLSLLVGEWDMEIRSPESGSSKGRAILTMLPGEQWVLHQLYIGKKLIGTPLTAYAADDREYWHYATAEDGFPATVSRGIWNERSGQIIWRKDTSRDVIIQTIQDKAITYRIVEYEGDKIVSDIELRLTNRKPLTVQQSTKNNSLLKRYIGTWLFAEQLDAINGQSSQTFGRVEAVKLIQQPLVVLRYLDSRNSLVRLRLINTHGPDQLFTNYPGWGNGLVGDWNGAISTMSWQSKAPNGNTLMLLEDFSAADNISQKVELRGANGQILVKGTSLFQKVPPNGSED